MKGMVMTVWFSNNFQGHWSVGAALLVTADTKEDAVAEAKRLCIKHELVFDGTVSKVDESMMLCGGNY